MKPNMTPQDTERWNVESRHTVVHITCMNQSVDGHSLTARQLKNRASVRLPNDMATHDQHRKSHILKRGRTPPFYFAVDATPKCWTVYDMTGGVPTLLVTHHFGGDYNNDGKMYFPSRSQIYWA